MLFGNGELPGPELIDFKLVKGGGTPPADKTDDKEKGEGQKEGPDKKATSTDKNSGGRKLMEEDAGMGGLVVKCTEFTEESLKFKMHFENPLEVSTSNGNPDKLEMKLRPGVFFAKGTGEELSGGIDVDVPIPKQFPSLEEALTTTGVATSVKTLMATNMILTFVIQFFFSQFISKIWPLYNIVQLLVVLSIVDVETPTNITLVLTEAKNAVELNAIPKEGLMEYV